MRIENPFSDDLIRAVSANRSWKQMYRLYKDDPLLLREQELFLREVIDSCPTFLCGDIVVLHPNGKITWGHGGDVLNMNPINAVRGNLFLFTGYESDISVCLQMDAGPTNQRLYHELSDQFVPFLRTKIFPDAFGSFRSIFGHIASAESSRLFITDENFELLDYDDPSA